MVPTDFEKAFRLNAQTVVTIIKIHFFVSQNRYIQENLSLCFSSGRSV